MAAGGIQHPYFLADTLTCESSFMINIRQDKKALRYASYAMLLAILMNSPMAFAETMADSITSGHVCSK